MRSASEISRTTRQGTFADRNAREDDDVRAEPDVIANGNFFAVLITFAAELGINRVVSGSEGAVGREHDVVANDNFHVVDDRQIEITGAARWISITSASDGL